MQSYIITLLLAVTAVVAQPVIERGADAAGKNKLFQIKIKDNKTYKGDFTILGNDVTPMAPNIKPGTTAPGQLYYIDVNSTMRTNDGRAISYTTIAKSEMYAVADGAFGTIPFHCAVDDQKVISCTGTNGATTYSGITTGKMGVAGQVAIYADVESYNLEAAPATLVAVYA